MRAFETVELRLDRRVATVTLNRPQRHNAYNVQMRDELHEVFGSFQADDELQVVVVRGSGASFCAGADLAEFGTAPSPFEARRIRFGRDVWSVLRAIPCPVIAVLHGHVIGTGLEMALHCDIRIADDTLKAQMPEARIGLVPAAGGTQLIPREVGPHGAARILLEGQPIGAGEAMACGLVHSLCAPSELEPELARLVARLVAWPAGALRIMKRCLTLLDELPLEEAARHERLLAAQAVGSMA